MMEPTKQRSKWMRPLAYAALAAGVFFVALWLLLPYDDMARGVENRLAAAGIEARLKRLHPITPLTLGVDAVEITRWNGQPFPLTLGPTTASLRLGPILEGKIGISVESESFGGTLGGQTVFPNPETVEATWRGVDLAQLLPLLTDKLPDPKGVSDGKASFSFPMMPYSRLKGTLDAELRQLSVGPGTVSGFPMPVVALGSGPLHLEAQNGRLRVLDTKLTGGDLDINVDGNLLLANPVLRSTVDATITLRPSGKAEGALGMFFGLLAPNKAPDGTYPLKIKGLLASPTITSR